MPCVLAILCERGDRVNRGLVRYFEMLVRVPAEYTQKRLLVHICVEGSLHIDVRSF